MARENRMSSAGRRGGKPIATARGTSAPIQNATATTCANTAGLVRNCGSAALAGPLAASAAPAPSSARQENKRPYFALVRSETLYLLARLWQVLRLESPLLLAGSDEVIEPGCNLLNCICPPLAHRANSRQRSTSAAFGAKRTLTEPRLQKAGL